MKRWSKPLKIWKTYKTSSKSSTTRSEKEEGHSEGPTSLEGIGHSEDSHQQEDPKSSENKEHSMASSVSTSESSPSTSPSNNMEMETGRRHSITSKSGGIFACMMYPLRVETSSLGRAIVSTSFSKTSGTSWSLDSTLVKRSLCILRTSTFTQKCSSRLPYLAFLRTSFECLRGDSTQCCSLFTGFARRRYGHRRSCWWSRRKRRLQQKWQVEKERKYPNPTFRDARMKKIIVRCKSCKRLIKSLRFSENPNKGIYPEYVDAVCRSSVDDAGEARKGPCGDWYLPKDRRLGIFVWKAIIQIVCLVLLLTGLCFFLAWYVVAILTPACTRQDTNYPNATEGIQGSSSARMHPTTRPWRTAKGSFSAAFTARRPRWAPRDGYVLFKGMCLGLSLDVALLAIFTAATRKAVEWENPKWRLFMRKFIDKSFLWLWFSWFGWYVPLGLLFVPFGEQFFNFSWIRPFSINLSLHLRV